MDTTLLLKILGAFKQGDFSVRMPNDLTGIEGKIADTLNAVIDMAERTTEDLTRVSQVVGKGGKIDVRLSVANLQGSWLTLIESSNNLIEDLASPLNEMMRVINAVSSGDLSKNVPVVVNDKKLKGQFLKSAEMVNGMVDCLSAFASEVTRVACEVGTEGKLGGQANVPGVAGTWKDLTESVNSMAANLTAQVRNTAEVATAIANGDLSRKITVDVRGEYLQLKETINTMVDQLSKFSSEVTRVAREVGTEGKLGGQAEVPGLAGIWKDLTDNVNSMADNLTVQLRDVSKVATAIARGDLGQKITVRVKGEILQIKDVINTMVDQLSTFSSEVTRVASEVGSEGMLGSQADVKGVAGTWKDLTKSVNFMAANLTSQVRNIALVTTAVAQGDLSKKITVEAKGEILQLKDTINMMVDQLSNFASEVTRVAREVGSEGKLGGQADVKGVGGTWKDLTDNVNSMAGNLTNQVRNIADVTTAVAQGNLSKKITVDVRGEFLLLKETINTMVDQLSTFASEVTRVVREVGLDGKLGGQAAVPGIAGTWKDLTENVNSMASNLTGQVRNIAEVATAIANGDMSRKITVDVRGEFLQLKETVNTMVDQLRSFASEVTRVAREVGMEGRLGGQAYVTGVSGTWKDLTESVNMLAANLTSQVRNIAQVTTAVANGDLSKKVTVDVKGEILELKNTVNTMVDQLNSFSAEVTRVAREVGTEGKLGGQSVVQGISGTWKDLTDNVNFMAANLTSQVRGIAKVVTAVANGNLKKKLTVEAKGEVADLAETINYMTDTLALFADQVTSVAREVGVEGKLGGQANVPGAAGTWKDLTDNVNQLAANLTSQVRAIAGVATAVTKGDLTQSVMVEAKGEVAELKDNVNEMIHNLRETTNQNSEQDWLKTNLEKFTRVLQGQRDLLTVSKTILSELAPLINAHQGLFYIMDEPETGDVKLKMLSSYAFKERKNLSKEWHIGEGLVGQCAYEKQRILLTSVPEDYIRITSGLGEARPNNIIVLPIIFEGKVKAVIELASFEIYSATHQAFMDQLAESIGIVLNTIEANMRTEELLKQSQSLASELGSQQEELRQTNDELETKARLLEEQKMKVDAKNQEVEQAKAAIEEKASQLAMTSKYKSEFLSNMSHELRTPLNSVLILAQQLADNPKEHLDDKEVEYAKTIHDAGNDLLSLINEILDLSKIESGTVSLELSTILFSTVREQIDRTFNHVAKRQKVDLKIHLSQELPTSFISDEKRLLQILKNLLSNAFKFTENGSVTLKIELVKSGWNTENEFLNQAQEVLAFTVIDTGIGISDDKQQIIFEAFQQADVGTSRKYGGTGLGLSISREITRLLNGELKLARSEVGEGSIFVLYLPQYDFRDLNLNNQTKETKKAPKSSIAVNKAQDKSEPLQLEVANTALSDDRSSIQQGDRVLLIIEDDIDFAKIILDLAREEGFKGIIAMRGFQVMELIKNYKPDAITLDIYMPDKDGWTILDMLKRDPGLRHIPVQIITVDEDLQRGLSQGAFQFITKPVSRKKLGAAMSTLHAFLDKPLKTLLLVAADKKSQKQITELLQNNDIRIKSAATGKAAINLLSKHTFDCVVVELKIPDMSGIEFISTLSQEKLAPMPLVLYSNEPLSEEERLNLSQLQTSSVVKSASTPARLLDLTALFLHRVITNLPADKRELLTNLQDDERYLTGKKVLIVDDDVRNIFALTAALERKGMLVTSVESGHAAVEYLKMKPTVDIILMDIMMPDLDGYETTLTIRNIPQYKKVPIIALTAKAMVGDKEKCLKAGASDYLSKPINVDQLTSLMQVWLTIKCT